MSATDDYLIAIRVEPGAAVPTAQRVAAELGKGEVAAERLGAAASRSFTAGAAAATNARDAFGRFVAGARQGSSAVDGAARAANGGVRAFDGLAEALRREHRVLDAINGPLRRYEQNLQTLDSLQGRGAITAAQYAEQVRKLNRELERQSTIKLTEPAKAPSLLGGVAKSGLGVAAAAGAGLLGAGAVKDMAVQYQDLQNKLRVVADDGESVASVFGKIDKLASDTRQSLEATTGAYQRLKGATKDLGMGSDDLFRVTERIAKAMKNSGAATAEQSASMQQLGQAIASGRLQGDELRSIMENTPYVARVIADSLGVSTGKLRELGEQGKLTSAVVVNAFERMGSKIDKDFGKTVPTLSEQWTMFRDRLMLVIGKLFEATGLFEILGGALGAVGSILGFVGDVLGLIRSAFSAVRDVVAGAANALDGLGGALGPVGDGLKALLSPLQTVKDAIGGVSDAAEAARNSGIGALLRGAGMGGVAGATTTARIARGASQGEAAQAYLDEMNAMKKLHAEYTKLEAAARTLEAAKQGGVENLPAFNLEGAKKAAETAGYAKQLFGIELPAAYSEATKKAVELEAKVAKIKEQRALDEQADQAKRAAKAMLGLNDAIDGHQKHWKSIRDELADVDAGLAKIEQTRQLIASHSGLDPTIEMHGKGTQDALDKTRLELHLTRQKRDLTDELNNSEYAYGETVVRIRKATNERKDDLEGVNAAYRDGRITLKEYTEELKRMGVEEDRATKLLKEIRQPAREYQLDVGALNKLLNQGRITLDEYSAAIKRATDAYGGPEMRKLLEGVGAPKPAPQVSLGGGPLNLGEGNDGLLDDALDPELLKQQYEVSQAVAEARRKYAEQVSQGLAELEQPQLADAPDLEKDLAAFEKQEEALKKLSAESKTLEDGLRRGLRSIRDEVSDTASHVEDALKNAFNGAREAFVSFVTTGKADMKGLVQSVLADMTRLLLNQAFKALIDGAAGPKPTLGGAAGGGAMEGLGAAFSILGLGSSIPGFARGGEGVVPGSGPVDSRLFVARVTPGEHYSFTPPGQQPAREVARAAPERPIRVVVVTDDSVMRDHMENHGETYYAHHRRREPAVRGRTTGR